jgi:hypothetical protein
MSLILPDDSERWAATLQQVFLDDFPSWEMAIPALIAAGVERRSLERACTAFFEGTGVGWSRYDEYLAYWSLEDPRLPEYDGDELVTDPDFRQAGELLAHRITMSYYQSERLRRYIENSDNRPYFKLVVIQDGKAYPDCLDEQKVIHRYDSPYWQTKQLPCARLFCRCSIHALTEREANASNI